LIALNGGVGVKRFFAARDFWRHILRVRYRGALAGAIELPAMEWAGDAFAMHFAAVAQMGAEVRAVGVEHFGDAGLGAEQHQLFAKIGQRFYFAGFEVIAVGDAVPAEGYGEVGGTGDNFGARAHRCNLRDEVVKATE